MQERNLGKQTLVENDGSCDTWEERGIKYTLERSSRIDINISENCKFLKQTIVKIENWLKI